EARPVVADAQARAVHHRAIDDPALEEQVDHQAAPRDRRAVLHMEMPLVGVLSVVADQRERQRAVVRPAVAARDGPCVVRVEIEVGVRPQVGAADSRTGEPALARLCIEAAAGNWNGDASSGSAGGATSAGRDAASARFAAMRARMPRRGSTPQSWCPPWAAMRIPRPGAACPPAWWPGPCGPARCLPRSGT